MNKYEQEYELIKSTIKSTSIYGLEICRLLLSFNHEIQDNKDVTPTVATNCKDTIYYNYKFLKTLSNSELLFVLVHEIYHCILSHVSRSTGKKFDVWNAACDYYINDKLIKDQIGSMPHNCLYKKAYSKLSPDQIYRLLDLSKESLENFDSHFPKDIRSSSESGDQNYSVSEAISDITKGSSICGSSFYKAIKDFKIPKKEVKEIDWRRLLKGSIKDFSSDRITFNRPSKKSSTIIFPKLHHDNTRCNAHLALDVSGSISNSEFAKFLSEIINILRLKKLHKLNLYLFDTQIIYEDQIRINSNSQIHSTIEKLSTLNNCGGGTDYGCVFKRVKKKSKDYLIIFTDGYPGGSWGTDQPNLIYLITSSIKSPIGKTFKIKL